MESVPGNDPITTYLDTYYDILDRMKRKMTAVRPTGSISRDFIARMISHHRAAVELSESVLGYDVSEEVRVLAETVIRRQPQGIAELEAILCPCGKVCNLPREVCRYRRRNAQVIEDMFSAMAHVSGVGVEQNFLREMLLHHEGAVRMAQNALDFCVCRPLRPILQSIVADQEEIGQIRQMLSEME